MQLARWFIALLTLATHSAFSEPTPRSMNCPASLQAQPDTLEGAVSHVYKTAGRNLRIHVFMPAQQKGTSPAILFYFGGGWRTGSITAFENQAKVFASRGYVAALADYRVYCRDQTSPLDALNDVQAAYEWMRQHASTLGVDKKRIALGGGSAGGHLALAAAMLAPADARPVALVLFNPVVDVMSLATAFDLPVDAVSKISPSALPTKDLPPTIAFHGTDDRTVPIDTVRTFCARARRDGATCELHEYAGQRHSFFHNRTIDPRISASPFDDTVSKALTFVTARVTL